MASWHPPRHPLRRSEDFDIGRDYHLPIGHFSEANFSFAEEQPHFRHLPSPIRAVGYQKLQLLQIDFLLFDSVSSASLKPDFAQL